MLINVDKEYIVKLKSGDITAFDTLFEKYSESIYAFALSITKVPYIAEEITQLVFLKIWEKRLRIDEHQSFKSFIFSIAYNQTISWLRKEKSEKRKINSFVNTSSFSSNETEYKIEFNNINSLANQIIEKFPEKRKYIFKLSREQGLTNKEIAKNLGISVKTVENQMTMALRTLREKLEKNKILGLLFYYIMFHI